MGRRGRLCWWCLGVLAAMRSTDRRWLLLLALLLLLEPLSLSSTLLRAPAIQIRPGRQQCLQCLDRAGTGCRSTQLGLWHLVATVIQGVLAAKSRLETVKGVKQLVT